MTITIIENKEHGFANLKFSDKPDYVKDKALLDELKANGWGYSKYNGVWYPRTNEAKSKANDFAKQIIDKYSEPIIETEQSVSQDHSSNEPVSNPVQSIELNETQKQIFEILKRTGKLSENEIINLVPQIELAGQTGNLEPVQKRTPKELSWEELKNFLHADDSFDLSKDLRELYHPTESETYQKIRAAYYHLHDIMDWDVLKETQYERSANTSFHDSMESIRKNILWDTCEKAVNGFFTSYEKMQEYFVTLRENEVFSISKNYMNNPEIKVMYKEMKRAELSERVPEILKGREFSSWISSTAQDVHFLFYESNGYLKSEYLSQEKYDSIKNFIAEVESEELLTDSAIQLKNEKTKMFNLLKTPAEEIKEDIEADKLDDLMDELIEEELYQNNQLEIESIESDESNENKTSKWLNEEDLKFVEYPGKEKTEEKSIELTEEDLEYAQKIIPEEQYMDMLQYANGEEAEHFKSKLKNAANIAREMINRKSSKELVNADGSHPCKLHYFIGGCDWYISELDKDGVGFGYAILNNDLTFSEWGSVNVCGDSTHEQPLTKMSVSVPVEINGREFRNSLTPQLDLYLDEDTTIERELYKRDNEYFNEYEKYAKTENNNEKELAKSSEVSINTIEETNQDLEEKNGSKIDNGMVGRTDSSSGSNLNKELEGQGESHNRGDNSGEGQRILSGEGDRSSELGHSGRIPGEEQNRPESRLDSLHSTEGLSSTDEALHSESSFETGNPDLPGTGMADNSTIHRIRSEQSGFGTGVRSERLENVSESSDPLSGTVDSEIEQEAEKYFEEVTKRYSTQYAEFFKNYDDVKNAHLENETRYVGDARIRSLFENTHKELVNLQFEELTDIIKNAKNLEIAKNAATRYFNFCGQDEFNYLHDNLFLRCHLGDYLRNDLGTTNFVAPNPEDLQNYITETFNISHGIKQEASKPVYNFFINDVANLDLGIGAEIEPITGLSAERAALKYAELKDKGLNPYIGINIPGDFIFDDKEGQGAGIFVETNGRPSLYMGDNFVKDLTKNDEHARNVIAAYKELYEMTDKYILGVERPDFVFEKEEELFGNVPSNDKEYAENLADWIVQHAMNESSEMENYSVSYEDILENTDTSEEWLNAHIDLINDALAAHNDNELLEYNPDENEGKEFNLYFCSNSDEMGENTLFKQNEEGRWIRKTEEELQHEKLEVNKTPDVPTKENVQKKMFILDKLHAAGIEVVTDKNEFDKILENHNILQKMETSSTEEKNPLFLADEKELKAFAQKVDDWKSGKLNSTEVISAFSTSTVLQAINIPANKVSVTQYVLHKINELETVKVGKSYGHDIDIATIKKIPEFLADPVMVFASASTPGSYVIMSETIDKKNRTIMVAMEINKQNANVIVNNITSAYGRNDNNFFIEQIKLGNLVYQNKQKSLEWTNERGLPLPPQMSTQGSLNVIQKEDIVNQKTPNFSFSERRLAFTENQQEFLRELGFTNSVDGDNSVLDWKMSKTIPETNKIIYFEIGTDRGSVNCFSCYEIDESKDNIVRTDLLRRYAEEKNAFEGFLTSISFNDRQNNFIVPYEKLGKVLSDEILEKLTDYIDDKAPKISRENFSNDIIDVAFKNKVRNLPAKFISEDIYSSGINPIGKELTFKVYKEVLKIAGVPVDDKKHYLLKIQTDNNYEYVHNKAYPRLYEAKWNRIKQVYTDEVELNLNSFNSKTIGNIQYIAANNCNYPNPPAQTMTLSDGKTYGFTYEGKIYLNPDIWNSEVAVHEYTHLWDNYIQRTNPELWEKGKQIFRNTRFWNEVKNDPNYADIADNNDLILSEIHARICGEMADKVLNKILEQEGKITADKVINWDNETWEYLLSDLGVTEFPITQSSDITFDEIRDFLSAPMKDLMNGLRITQNMNIDNSPKPDNPQHTLSWEELELDPNVYDSYGEVPSDETEFKEWALGLQLENELDLRGFDTGLENVSNEDNSRISEQKWAILDDLSHRIVYGELKYEPHNYDYSNQQKEYDRLLKENPVFQELTSKGVIKADFENPFIVSAEEKKVPLTMLKAEDVEVIKNPDELQNTISKLETIIKETYLTIPEGEESLTHDELQRRYDKWTRPMAREILEELKNGNQNIIKLINDFDLNKETHLKEGTYGTAEQRFKHDVQYELMPALYKEVQNKIIEKYDENKTPYVILHWSESPVFSIENKVYTLKEFNELLTQADKEFHDRKEYAEKKYGSADNYWRLEDAGKLPEEDKGITFGYDKTEFKLCNIPNLENPEDTYSYEASRYDIGDGDGSVFDFIRTTCSHDVLIESCNKLEREMYYPEIEESQRVFVENAAKEEAALLKQNLVEKKEALDNAQQEYTELHKKWLIEASEAERVDEQINKALADIKATYDNSISNLYTKVLNEYPFAANENISDSQFMLYTANEAKKMVLSELYLPSLESAKDYSKYNANDWDKFRKIFKQFPAKVNMTEYVENLLQEKCNEIGISVSENIAQEERPVEQLTSKKDIKAIREQCREILQKPDSEITEADKAILAQYEGAGGIKEENRTAAGVLNEFYTPNNLVEKVWQIVDAYAPDAKTVLEPSAGVGKFANNRPNNEFTMHELDETSARINKILHPEANIIQGAYQKQFFDAGGRIHMPGQKEHYDVVIGNPPYGLYNDKYKGLGEGKEFDRYEEYFISKGLDALKDENSIMAFVIPSGFLNNASDKQKEIIASKGKLIDAYRLPVGTFPTTDVGTDIIIMTSWEKDRNEIDLNNQLVGVKAHAQLTNERLKKRQENYLNILSSGKWFKQHPEKILGEVKTRTNRFGKIEEYVAVHEGLTVQDELNKIDSMIPKKNYEFLSSEHSEQLELMGNEKISQNKNQKEPAPVQPEQTQSVSDQSETVAEEIDDPSKRLYEDPDGVFKTNHKLTRQEFAQFYTGANFTSEDYNIWGATDWKGIVDLSKLTAAEQNFLKTSENYVEIADGVYTNAMLYATGNIYEKLDALEEEKESLSEASYNRAKQILENAIPKIVPIEQIKMDALSPLADEFKVSREVTSSYWNLGSSQLNTSVQSINLREDFINWATNCSSLDNFDEKNQPVNTRRAIYNYSTTKIAREDIPEDISWTDIVNYIDKIPVPTHINEKEDTKEVKNKKNLIAGNIKDARKNTCYTLFNRYLQEGLPQEDKERLQTTWNKIYNATVHADYKKLPLFIEGMNTFKGNNPFMLYKQQVEGISRLLSKGNGLLAYEVGVGKTAAGIVTTMGQLQLERCKRPLIIVPNQVYKKWVNDFRQLFPDVKINELYNLSEKYISHNYDEKTHSLVIEPNTVTVITDSALQKITFSDKACQTELAEDFGYLLGLSEAINSGDDKIRAEAYQKIMKEVGQASRIQVKKLPEGREQEIQQSYIFFDECGFDNVVIDEAHRYKNLFTVPRPKRGEKTSNEFQGLGTGKPSIRAEKVFGITTLIQRHNEDRNVFLLTATPFTNNPLEVYSMLSYMGRKELINRHIYDVRDFCTEFAQTKFEYAVKPSGDIEPKQVMKNFRGQKKLKNLVFEYIDPVTAEEAGIARPEGARHPIYLELSPLQDRIIKLEQETITKSDNPYVMLKAMTTMRTCTLSPALLDPEDFAGVEDIVIPPKSQIVESSPKLSWVCNTCADLYKQKPECGQFIYMPQGKDCFDEVKEYLIRQGIPEEAIDYIHSTHNGSAEDKDKISARFNDVNDKLKILIGTATVAEGIDLNGNSIVEYNTMLGWNPTESIQVEGRIWRQGNLQGKVHIMYPLMENSIDALIYQKHDEKAHRINSVLSKSDDGNDVIDTDEINPETIKFDLITDPTKKVKMIINEKTAEKRKEMKVIDNRIETLQELENDRQDSKSIYDLNVAEKEKYKTLLKTCREELKYDPENWQKQARVEANERNVEVCNKEIAKAKNRLSTISYNFNKFDIHDPEREVPIKLQELVTKKAELNADVKDIIDSEARLVAEEQKKLLEKKMLSKPVEQLRKEWVEFVLKDTWYKETSDKSKDNSKTVQKPLEAVKDFKVPDVMLKNLDKAIAEKDFKILEDYLCWGDRTRTTINDMNENDKAIEIMRKRYEKATGVQLPQDIHKTIDYLVSVCDEKTLSKNCQFKSMEEAVEYVAEGFHGEAYQRDGYVEYITLDNFKKNRNVAELAKALQKNEGQSWLGHGSAEFGYMCNPKRVKIEAFINRKREEFFVSWNDIAKLKAKQWNKEYPLESTIKVDEEEMKKISTAKVEQLDLFGFDELKQQARTLDVRYGNTVDSVDLLKTDSLKNYKGLPPFIKKSDNEWVIRCKGKDFAITNNFYKDDIVDVSITKQQLRTMVKAHLDNEAKIIQQKQFDNPGFDGKVKTPKPEVGEVQKALLMENGISEFNVKAETKKMFNELLCDSENPILKKKENLLPQKKQAPIQNKPNLLPGNQAKIPVQVEIIETDFDYEY